MIKSNKFITPLFIILAGILLFIPFLGRVPLFDWDEINFAESAREMIRTGDYFTVKINYLPFWEKPPLFIWMQVLSMKLFGISAFSARFPNAMGGILSLLVLYFIGKKHYTPRFGVLWVLVYAGSILPQIYFKSGIIDPWFNLFIFLAIYYMVLYLQSFPVKTKISFIIFSGFFTGMGILTKGPVALLIIGLSALVWLIWKGKWDHVFHWKFLLVYLLVLTVSGGSWFLLEALDGKAYLIMDFLNYQVRLFSRQDAGHGGFLFYHFFILFFGVFPASVFFLKSFRKNKDEDSTRLLLGQWMMISFWVVLLLFTIVRTKIVHYSSFCYFPITFLATQVIFNMIEKKQNVKGWLQWTLIIVSFIFGALLIGLQLFIKYKDRIIASGIIHDPFAIGNLQANVYWTGWEFLVGMILLIGIPLSIFLFRHNIQKQVIGIFVTSLLFINLTLMVIVPRVEQYSQHAALDFFKGLNGMDVYVTTWGYKSYAPYFYANLPVPENKNWHKQDWLLTGPIDKPVYVATKNYLAKSFIERYSSFQKLYEKNGFVFFVREKNE